MLHTLKVVNNFENATNSLSNFLKLSKSSVKAKKNFVTIISCSFEFKTNSCTWVDVQAQSQSYSYYRAAIYEDQWFFPLYMAAIARVVLVNVIRADGYTALERIFNWRALQTKWLVKKDC